MTQRSVMKFKDTQLLSTAIINKGDMLVISVNKTLNSEDRESLKLQLNQALELVNVKFLLLEAPFKLEAIIRRENGL